MRRIGKLARLGLAIFTLLAATSLARAVDYSWPPLEDDIYDNITLSAGDNTFTVDQKPWWSDYYQEELPYGIYGTIQGAGNFVKDGAEALYLSPPYSSNYANTYIGNTTVKDGTLYIYDWNSIDPNATILVTGDNSRLISESELRFGTGGNATVRIENGATVETAAWENPWYMEDIASGNALIGRQSDATTTVTVDGIGSLLKTNAGYLIVWYYVEPEEEEEEGEWLYRKEQTLSHLTIAERGTGILQVTNGGEVFSNADILLGSSANSSGFLRIEDSGSKVKASRDLWVGQRGHGRIEVTDGGLLEVGGRMYFGRHGSDSVLVVSGSGSTVRLLGDWTGELDRPTETVGSMYVGYVTDGEISIFDRGTVAGIDLLLGYNASGSALLSGSGSTLDFASITVGRSSVGLLRLVGGATVGTTTGDLTLADAAGSRATVLADGTISVAGTLRVANLGRALLSLDNASTVTAAGGVIIGEGRYGNDDDGWTYSDGTFLVGNLSSVQTGGTIIVGNEGRGHLAATGGGKLNAAAMEIGATAYGTGSVLVHGAQSRIALGGNLNIGRGALDIRDGAGVTATGALTIGGGAGSSVMIGESSSLSAGLGTTIGQNGLLSGTGTLSSNVTAVGGGTISPGDYGGQAGTLTISGTLALEGGGRIQVDNNTPVEEDSVRITGNADIHHNAAVSLSSLHRVDDVNSQYKLTVARAGRITKIPVTEIVDDEPVDLWNLQIQVNGLALTDSRLAAVLEADPNAITVNVENNNSLVVTVKNSARVQNYNMTWDGGDDDADWDLASANWVSTPATDPATTKFFDGDAVTFNDGGANITILGTQKLVARMTVSGADNWTFNGNIIADGTRTTLRNMDGKLLVNNASGQLTLNGRNEFHGGIDITGGTPTIVLGNDLALGTFVPGEGAFYDTRGQVVVYQDADATISTSEDRVLSNRFHVGRLVDNTLSNGSLHFSIGSGSTLSILNNNFTGSGGAICVDENSSISFSGSNLIFAGNTAVGDGGAMAVLPKSDTSGILINNLNTLTFSGNQSTAGNAGALYLGGDASLIGITNLSFLNNTARNNGGAVYALESLAVGSGALFSNNTAQASGGAVSIQGIANEHDVRNESTIASGARFYENRAGLFGGAIYSAGDLAIYGNTHFRGNSASRGGAVYMAFETNLKLDSFAGAIVFSNNGEAVFLDTANLSLSGSNAVYFGDSLNANATVIRNPETGAVTDIINSTITVGLDRTAFVQFRGANSLGGVFDNEQVNGSFVAKSGIVRFSQGASFTGADLTLENAATLAGAGSVSGTSHLLQGTISLDKAVFTAPTDPTLAIEHVIADTERIATMNFTGDLVIDGIEYLLDIDEQTSDQVVVDGNVEIRADSRKNTIRLDTWIVADYDILIARSGTLTDGDYTELFDVTYIDGSHPVEREAFLLSHIVETDREILRLSLSDDNSVYLVWRGFEDMTWEHDNGKKNWVRQRYQNERLSFINGDHVIFDGTPEVGRQGTITIAASGVAVSGMDINGGTYIFTGGTISSTDIVTGNYITPTQLLTISGGTVTFRTETDFAEGTRVTGGRIDMQRAKALGSYTGTAGNNRGLIAVEGDATLMTTLEIAAQPIFSNRITVAEDATLTFDFFPGSLTSKKFTFRYAGGTTTPEVDGGAIALAGNLAFTENGELAVENYRVTGKGGAVYAAGTVDHLDFSDLDALTLTGNRASFGGGIYSELDITFSGKTLLASNTAEYGGALAIGSQLSGEYPASDETLTLTIGGNTRFRDNTAGKLGGAVYLSGSLMNTLLTFDTTAGDIAFHGNTHAGGANSVYFRQNTALHVWGGNNLFFDDPFTTSTEAADLAGNSFLMDGTGFVQFRGRNLLNPTGKDGGSVIVNAGTLRTASDGILETFGKDSWFDVNRFYDDEGELLGYGTLAGGGMFRAEKGFRISGDISPDGTDFAVPENLDGFNNPPAIAEPVGTLTLDGDVYLDDAVYKVDLAANDRSDRLNVLGRVFLTERPQIEADDDETDGGSTTEEEPIRKSTIDIVRWVDGFYTIANAQDGFDIIDVDEGFEPVTVMGNEFGNRQTAHLELLGKTDGSTDLKLTLQSSGNLNLVWNGDESMTWNLLDVNWHREDDPTTQLEFASRDYVIFDATGEQGVVTVAGSGVEVAGMEIRGGRYTFDGAEGTLIRGSVSGNSAATQTGALTVYGGTTTLNIETEFENGVILAGGTLVLGHDLALGRFDATNTANSVGTVYVPAADPDSPSTGSSTIRVTEDRNISNRFLVAAHRALIFDVAEGTTLHIAGVDVADAGLDGGVLQLDDASTLLTTNSGGTLLISDSKARNGGAIFSRSTIGANLSSFHKAVFSRNEARESGGAIRTTGPIEFGNRVRFEDNRARYGGGAIKADNDLTFGEGTQFVSNIAQEGNGGAIDAGGSLTIGGDSFFIGNVSGGLGGAIAISGGTDADNTVRLVLDATVRLPGDEDPTIPQPGPGDIVFTGNREGVTFDDQGNLVEGSGIDNAIRLRNNTDLVLTGLGGIFFNDRLDSDDGATGNSLTKTGEGFVQFLGENTLNRSGQGGIVSVEGGTFRVVRDATFATYGDEASFTMKNPATLAGGGTLVAENGFVLGGRIAPDLAVFDYHDAEHLIAPSELIGTLTLDGDVVFSGVILAVDLDRDADGTKSDRIDITGHLSFTHVENIVDIGQWMTGTFDIAHARGGIDEIIRTIDVDGQTQDLPNIFCKVTLNGEALGSRQYADVRLTEDGKTLQLVTSSNNMNLTWTGTQNMNWNTTDDNWVQRDGGGGELFNPLDHVLFDGRGQGKITVAGTSMSTGGMIVSAGSYEFVGGAIRGYVQSGRFQSDGKLVVGESETIFNTGVDFEGGIDITRGAKVGTFGQNVFHTDGDLWLGVGATLYLDAADNKLKGRSVVLDGDVVVTDALNLSPDVEKRYVNVVEATEVDLDQRRLDELFTRTIALWGQTPEFTSSKTMDLVYGRIGLDRYSRINKLGWNMDQVSRSLAQTFTGHDMLELKAAFNDCMSNAEVDYLLNDLRGVEQISNAMALSFWKPWRVAFRMIDREERREGAVPLAFTRGQARQKPLSNFWLETTHFDADIDNDGNALQNGLSRTGMALGTDVKLSGHTTVGLMLGYGQGWTYSQFGRVETEDYTFAVFSKSHLNWGWEAYAFLGYGHQGFESRRDVLGQRSKAKYDGDTYYMAGRLVRPYVYNRFLTWLPTIGFDVQSVATNTFNEHGSDYSMRVGRSDMQRSMFNIGLNSHWRVNDWATIDGRLMYSRRLSDDTFGEVSTVFLAAPDSPAMRIRGVDVGRDAFNVGIGGQAYLNTKRSVILFGDYDYDVGPKSFSSSIQFGFISMW